MAAVEHVAEHDQHHRDIQHHERSFIRAAALSRVRATVAVKACLNSRFGGGGPLGRSVPVPGHSNVACGAFGNMVRLGWRTLLRPMTGSLRNRREHYFETTPQSFPRQKQIQCNGHDGKDEDREVIPIFLRSAD